MMAWLLDTLLYTGLLIALVLAVRVPVARHFGPQTAYALWALPLLRLVLPPITLPAAFAPAAPAAPADAGSSLQSALLSGTPETLGQTQGAQALGAAGDLAGPGAGAFAWAEAGPVLGAVWFGVALGFLAWRMVTYRQMRRRLLADARPVGEVGRIRLVETPALPAPVAFGVRDKVIALPRDFMAQHDRALRDLAIQHELAHHRGHDLLANFAAQALLALHWFNPIAWLGWRAMRRDQEAACDARVLARADRQQRARYATLIAHAATGPRLALVAPMACPVLGDKSIVHRLRLLARGETSPRRRLLGRGLIVAGVLALPFTASLSYAQRAPEAAAASPSAAVFPETRPALWPATGAAAAGNAQPPAGPASARLPQSPQMPGTATLPIVVFPAHLSPPVPPVPPGALLPPPAPPAPPATPPLTDPLDPRFEAEMERWSASWEHWGEQWERWGEALGAQAEAQAEQAVAAAAMHEAQGLAEARASLRTARASIAGNSALSEQIRREIMQELDAELAQLGR